MADQEARISKIQKLMAKAEANGTTDAERETLNEKIAELIVLWEIDEAMLTIGAKADPEARKIDREIIPTFGPKAYHMEMCGLAHLTMKALGLRCIQGYKKDVVHIIGPKADRARAIFLLRSLWMQATTARSQFARTQLAGLDGSTKWNQQRAFVVGFSDAVYDRLRKMRRDTIQAAAASSGKGNELVLATDHTLAIDRWVAENMSTKNARVKHYSGFGVVHGNDAGNKADLGQDRVGNTSSRKAVGQ